MLELPTGAGAAPNYAVDFKDGTRVVNGTVLYHWSSPMKTA